MHTHNKALIEKSTLTQIPPKQATVAAAAS